MEEVTVSVLMTVYNREDYLALAIESVLASTYHNFELIIVDDCSKDRSVEIAESYALKDDRISIYKNEKNLGDYGNRNKAAGLAKGKYLKYLDSDDYIYSFSLGYMVECMEKYSMAAYGFSHRKFQLDDKHFPVNFSPNEAYKEHFFRNGFFYASPGSSIIRKDIFDAAGKFSGKRYVGDYELWLKLSAKYDCIVFQPGLIWWRIHEGQEFDLGQKDGNYILANYQCVQHALLQQTPPLSAAEKDRAMASQKALLCRKLLKKFSRDSKTCLRIYKACDLTVADMLTALVPLRLRFQK
jgi:glycosyltransferase involved in cell wall biosynthesis